LFVLSDRKKIRPQRALLYHFRGRGWRGGLHTTEAKWFMIESQRHSFQPAPAENGWQFIQWVIEHYPYPFWFWGLLFFLVLVPLTLVGLYRWNVIQNQRHTYHLLKNFPVEKRGSFPLGMEMEQTSTRNEPVSSPTTRSVNHGEVWGMCSSRTGKEVKTEKKAYGGG